MVPEEENKQFRSRIDYLLELYEHRPSPWRIFKIMAEFVNGFDLVRKYHYSVTFFGSARLGPTDPYYCQAQNLASQLAKRGFTIITGGGPGIMEAANRGAYEAGGQSIGLNIKLPQEQSANKYTTDSETFHYFFTRKVMLSFAAEIYIFFPGGFGTLDELFEIVTLVQTKKIPQAPIILVGHDFWQPLLRWIHETVFQKYKAIDEVDEKLCHVVDSADEAFALVRQLIDEGKIKL